MSGYTIEADLRRREARPAHAATSASSTTATRSTCMGNHQRLQLRTWASELEFSKQIEFPWQPDVWYRMKLRVEPSATKVVVRGKVWKKAEPEPAAWTIEYEDASGILAGAPGIYGDSSTDLYFDNVQVMVNDESLALGRARRPPRRGLLAASAAHRAAPLRAAEPDRALFGATPRRNMVSAEKGLPAKWDIKTGKNVKWSAKSGSQSYAGPVVAGRQGLRGHQQRGRARPRIKGDKGVVMAFDAKTGDFLWQMVTDKLPVGPRQRLAAAGRVLHPVRGGQPALLHLQPGHIVSLDTEGLKDGNRRASRPRSTRARTTAT